MPAPTSEVTATPEVHCGCGVTEAGSDGGRKAVGVEGKERNLKRLRRIEGQVRGLQKMVDDDRYVQEIKITVKGGYSPDVIAVKQGVPVKLDFYRDESASCTEQVVFGDFGIARDLPAFRTTSIEFTPDKAGEFTFACGMNMVRGKLVVEAQTTG